MENPKEPEVLLRIGSAADLDAFLAALQGINEWGKDITGGDDSELVINGQENGDMVIYFKGKK